MKTTVFTEKGAKPIGPYSPGVRAGDFIFVSGQGPADPQGKIHSEDIREQTRAVLNNIRVILEAAGATMHDVVRCNVYLADLKDFQAMNEVYREFLGPNFPTRTTVGTLLLGIKVEIDAIAYTGSK